jgi:Zn-dependent alcohol dehydrogenase
MKMQAAVLNAAEGRLDVEQVEIGEVRVKIAASGLCHTDWETMRGYQPVNLPAIIGHEGAGIVDRVGPGVSHVEEGDHVTYS